MLYLNTRKVRFLGFNNKYVYSETSKYPGPEILSLEITYIGECTVQSFICAHIRRRAVLFMLAHSKELSKFLSCERDEDRRNFVMLKLLGKDEKQIKKENAEIEVRMDFSY
jgi:hypothetical protein